MINNESEKNILQENSLGTNICDLRYLTEMMGWKKPLIKGVIDAFLKQIPEELLSIHNAILKIDYATIRSFAHTMKSSVSIMGVSSIVPVLQKMEDLATKATDIERIKELNQTLNSICNKAMEEIEREKHNYI